MLMPLEIKKNVANDVDSFKTFIGRALSMNLHGWEIYIDTQPVTICIAKFHPRFDFIMLHCCFVALPFAVIDQEWSSYMSYKQYHIFVECLINICSLMLIFEKEVTQPQKGFFKIDILLVLWQF